MPTAARCRAQHARGRAVLPGEATASGAVARIAGDTIGAKLRLPNMASEAFLSCLSRPPSKRVAAAEGVRVEVRGKDTRARLIERFKDGVYVYPDASSP